MLLENIGGADGLGHSWQVLNFELLQENLVDIFFQLLSGLPLLSALTRHLVGLVFHHLLSLQFQLVKPKVDN